MSERPHVLIVDDEPNVRRVLATLLEQAGFSTTRASSGERALDLVRAQDPDLVLTDLRMPGMDGMELLGKLTASFPEIPVVMLTAFSQKDYVEEASRAGAMGYLVKPFTKQDVLPAKIANCLQLDYPPEKLTLLFGSDGSNDRTADILSQIHNHRFRTTHFPNRRGKVRMLNHLMRLVDTDIVVFSDANTMYKKDAIFHLVKHFTDPAVGCVIGKQILYAPHGDEQSHATQPA